MNKHARVFTAIGGTVVLGGALLTLGPASATPSPNYTICHATNSDTNPYVVITVDASSIQEANNSLAKLYNGHGDHDGPLWSAESKADHEKWGDIIAPFSYTSKGKTVDYPGSAAYWANDGGNPEIPDECPAGDGTPVGNV
jgi:hypothetical protein